MHPDAAQREAQDKHESALSAASERETERQVEHERERERVLERLKHVQDIEAAHAAIAEAKRSQQTAEDAARQAARAQDIAEKSAEQAELAQQAAEAECEQLLATVDKLECQLLATAAAHAASSASPAAKLTGRSEHAGEVEATHEHRVLSAENKALAKKVNVLEEALADVSTSLDKTTAILRMQTTSFMQSVSVTRAVEELQRQEGAWRKDHEQLSAQIAAKQNECNLIQAQLQQLSASHSKGGLLDSSIAGEDGIALSNVYEDTVKDMAQVSLRES